MRTLARRRLLGSDQQQHRRLDRGEIRGLAAIQLRDHSSNAGREGRAVVGQPAGPSVVGKRAVASLVARDEPLYPARKSAAQAAISAASSLAAANRLYPVTTGALTRSGW
jgi:hypothetical protein